MSAVGTLLKTRLIRETLGPINAIFKMNWQPRKRPRLSSYARMSFYEKAPHTDSGFSLDDQVSFHQNGCYEACKYALSEFPRLNTIAKDLFKNGSSMCWLEKSETQSPVAIGWISGPLNDFHIRELDLTLEGKSGRILYGFNTRKSERKKGYYQTLLRAISHAHADKRLLIYAARKNTASIRGIEGAGFRFLTPINLLSKYRCMRGKTPNPFPSDPR